MNPRIVGTSGLFKGAVRVLTQGELKIGREPSNHLWVSDSALSRYHCAITAEGGRFAIRDLDSRNGTLVNGVPVERQDLRHGDQISIGDSVLAFLLDETAAREPAAVELSETIELAANPTLLAHQEGAFYQQLDKMAASLPQSERLTRDFSSLLQIAKAIGGFLEREALQGELLGMLFDIVPAESGAFLLLDNSGEVSSAVSKDRSQGPGHPLHASRTVVARALRERAGLLFKDASLDLSIRDVPSLSTTRIHSILCVPLVISDKALGVIYLVSASPAASFDETHLEIVSAVASLAGLALENLRLLEGLREENRLLRTEIDLEHTMIGGSARMREVYELIRRVSPVGSTVLILGESGTGKELVARAIHRNSPRKERPFVAINCAAITDTLLESELFGHEKGAFTGAAWQTKGKLEAADGGALFLDEVGELAPGLQAKLLRVLQEREFERVGGTRPVKVDIRLIAASNRDLRAAAERGEFRQDLYYRLNVVAVTMPPLRLRREDIPLLADSFIAKFSRKCGCRKKPLSAAALSCLMRHDWPGNVRELENAIERAVVLGAADSILPEDLPEAVLDAGQAAPAFETKYHGAIKEHKKQLIVRALQQAKGNYIEAAGALGLHPNSLLRLMRTLDLKGVT